MKHANVTFEVTIESEDIPVRGNYMASGDDTFDKECEDEILTRLENGDDSAWCCVKVTATLGDFSGSDYLGCVTLTDDYTAEQCAADHDMHAQALEALKLELTRAAQQGTQAKRLLTFLEKQAS